MVVDILKGYMIFLIILIMAYVVRHFIFAVNRMYGRQRLYYNDIISDRMKSITVIIPMHNEENVAAYILDALLDCDYDREMLEIIPVNDNSTDGTRDILEAYHEKYDFIRPLHRQGGLRGKPAGLNDAMKLAKGEIILVFDADYRPARDLLKQLAVAFENPEVGAVMGRVIPYNADKNILTRLINIERSGGYQVDQQARYNLKTIPQYGGTVGGFRKDILLEEGGFDTRVLAEDTELTYRLYTKGWKVIYANSAECYEEAPETWSCRAKQIRRWSRGHNQVMFKYFFKTIFSGKMRFREKLDGIFLLGVYMVPFCMLLGQMASLALFFLGEMNILSGWWVLLFLAFYCAVGNFAPFFEIGTALFLDGIAGEIYLLPLLLFNFYFYMWNISRGFIDAVIDVITRRRVCWVKTVRFAKKKQLKGD